MSKLIGIAAMGALMLSVGCASAPPAPPPPMNEPPKFSHLAHAREQLDKAHEHLKAAEAAHAEHGTLGGHGGQAVHSIDAALAEIEMAQQFAVANQKPGPGGEITPKPALTAMPDDGKYPNLGEARLETEQAIRNLEDAEQFHAPIGTLGGHAAKAVEQCREALREISEAEHFADNHH